MTKNKLLRNKKEKKFSKEKTKKISKKNSCQGEGNAYLRGPLLGVAPVSVKKLESFFVKRGCAGGEIG